MSVKFYLSLIIVLLISNLFFLYQAIKYRNAVAIRNKNYDNLPSFPRYKNDNYQFKRMSEKCKIDNKYSIFIGSSLIERWDFPKYFPNKPFINRGIGDETSTEILRRFKDDVIELNPSSVVVYISSNDVKYHLDSDKSKDNLAKMIKLCRKNNIELLVLLVLPVQYKDNPSLVITHPSEKINKLNEKLSYLCKIENTRYLNFISIFSKQYKSTELYLKDGLHLNDTGYEVLSKTVMKELDSRL